ncbi:hypothetical protein GOP47_0019875 [Adiantum capillus-veneris]|uniref:Uncharacterized protein n=1 Tax=Adiantum capillus-veneris TaxID=13818 RepID=A0A9D4UC51_ADICA|nr:hypothetical protein GOP47_0019875 [Adiantum capillus-veneris]
MMDVTLLLPPSCFGPCIGEEVRSGPACYEIASVTPDERRRRRRSRRQRERESWFTRLLKQRVSVRKSPSSTVVAGQSFLEPATRGLLSPSSKEMKVAALNSSCACKACLSNHLAARSSVLLTWRRVKCNSRIVCLQKDSFGLENVSQALQQIGDRITKNENVVRLGEFLKHDGEKKQQSQRVLEKGNVPAEGSEFPFPKSRKNKDSDEEHGEKEGELELPYVSDRTFDAFTPNGELCAATISCIEQFSRLSGYEGSRMIREFDSQCTDSFQKEARHLVEYCCFKYLAGCSKDIHPQLKDASFRKLLFITMLSWQQPYNSAEDNRSEHEKMVGKGAFVRIAPAVAGIADRPTALHLYEILSESREGLSYIVWDTYILELLRVHEERMQHKLDEGSNLSLDADETVLCVGASKRQPVQMWNSNNIPWPGRLTLTERALYFEPNGIFQHQKAMKLDLTGGQGTVERKKVGPLGAPLYDSAIAVSSDSKSNAWVIEFVNFSGDGRREVWFAFIDELLSAYAFISEYGPAVDDPVLCHIQGSQHGNRKVIASAINGIARVQAAQSTLGRLIESPGRLLQFSRINDNSVGDLVKQALAVNLWGGKFDVDYKDSKKIAGDNASIGDAFSSGLHITNIDGSVYLQRWMKSPTWQSPRSSSFWKHKAGVKGLILGKDLVVGDLAFLERAVKVFKDQSQMLERTKATIDGALVKGIPSNIDLLKELMLPFTIMFINLRKLQRWQNPQATVIFLGTCLLVLYKGWLRYSVPVMLLTAAVLVFTLHNLKSRGRLGDGFGRVVIREQPPSNTLQKILALKEALAEMEIQIQKANIALLKLRNLALAGHPQGRNMVAFALLAASLVLTLVPFRYVCVFVLLDQFTCELEFRRGMVLKLARQLEDWWGALPAAPVVVLPYEKPQDKDSSSIDSEMYSSSPMKGEAIAEAVREWVAESF